MRWFFLAVSFLVAVSLYGDGAVALMKAGPGVMGHGLNVGSRPAATAPALPGDTVPMTVFWGLRAYSSAQLTGTTNALRVRRSSDNFEYDVKILPNGDLDVGPGSGPLDHCASTSCFVSILYDQVAGNACGGASCNLVQTNTANQPSFVFNCLGTKPCIQGVNTTTMVLVSANNFTPATGVASLYYVGGRTTGVAGTVLLATNNIVAGQRLLHTSSVNVAYLYGGTSGNFSRPAPDGAVHVLTGVVNSAASVLYVDGVGGSGTATGNTVAAAPAMGRAGAATTVSTFEGGFIDNVAISQAQAEALNTSARAYYGIP